VAGVGLAHQLLVQTPNMKYTPATTRRENGKAGWLMLWLLGVPIPVLLVLFQMRGCT
jgi:hypothetical protein